MLKKLSNPTEISPEASVGLLSREEIQRSSLKSNDVRRLLIRIDFVGVTDILSVVKSLSEPLKNDGFRFRKQSNPTLADIPDDLSDVYAYNAENLPVYTFISENLENSQIVRKLTICVSEFSISLDLNCSEYDGFDTYRNIITDVLKILVSCEAFVEIKRIAVSKTSAFYSNRADDIRSSIVIQMLPDPIVIERYPQCTYTDKFYWVERALNVKLNRELVWGKMIMEGEEAHILRVTLNFDVYKDYLELNKDSESIKQQLDYINDAQFELFKKSMTEDYLNKHCNV